MKIRVTGVLVEEGKILVLNQDTDEKRSWSLPGGKVEEGEELGAALKREMLEETGLEVEVERLLYLADYISEPRHVVHITFAVRRMGGHLGATAGLDTRIIRSVDFADVDKLTELGFTSKFQELVREEFPRAGTYVGSKTNIGL